MPLAKPWRRDRAPLLYVALGLLFAVALAFTDGVSEAMNVEMVEWGEDRPAAFVRALPPLEPRALIDGIIAEADRHVAGAPQHHDMTLLVVRRKDAQAG